jgi:hypothetical protein
MTTYNFETLSTEKLRAMFQLSTSNYVKGLIADVLEARIDSSLFDRAMHYMSHG